MADTQNDLDQLLQQRPWLAPVPEHLQQAYRSKRQEEFARLVRLWSPLLPMCFIGFQAFTLVFYTALLQGADLALLLKSGVVDIGLLAGGLMAAHQSRWRGSFDRWIPWVFGLITALKVIVGFMLHSSVLAINQVYITLMVLVIGMLALQLPLRSAVRGCSIGAAPFLALPWIIDIRYGLLFLGHYLLTALVAVFVVAVREDKDRMMFLQSMRFQQERQEVQRLNAELAEMARKDALTGLANRRVFDESLRAEWDRARRNRTSLALLMIDVDHFKRFNDRYGHPAGDRCLTEVAAAIASVVRRPGDVAARYGGEEFVILLPDTEASGAAELARRVIEQVDAAGMAHEDSPTAANVTVSVGVSFCLPHGSATAQGLTDAADEALYEAKSTGRHRFVCHEWRALDGQ